MKKTDLEAELAAAQQRVTELETLLAQQVSGRQVTEQFLAESSGRFHNLFETMAQGVTYQDANGAIILANPAAERILGLSLDELQGRKSVDPRWRTIHEDGSDFLGEQHPAMLALQTGKPVNDVVMGVFHPQENSYRWILVNAVPEFRNETTRPFRVFATFTDITAQRQAEVALQEREQKLRKLLEALPVGVSVLDTNSQVVFGNPALCQILQMTDEGLLRGDYRQRQYLAADGSSMPPQGFASAQAQQRGEAVYNVETGIVTEAGQTIWTSVSAVPVDFPDWKTVIVTMDITERKQLEDSLRESEQKYSTLFEKSAIPAVLLKLPEVIIADVNESIEKLTGYRREEMLGRTAAELGLISHQQRTQAISQFKARGELAENEKQIVIKSGAERVVISRTNRLEIGGQPYAITTLEDVTERKQAEIKRDQLAERLDLATRSAHMGIWDWDIVQNEIVWDDQMYALYGLQPGEFGGAYEAWLQGVHLDDREASNEVSVSAVRGEREYDTEFRVLWPDGSVHWLKATGQVFRDMDGTPLRMVGINYDVTEQKLAEQKLRESEAQLRALVTSLDDLVFEVDEQGTYLNVWTSNEAGLFRPRAEIIGKRFDEVFGEAASRPFFEFLEHTLRTGAPQTLDYPMESVGVQRWFSARYNLIQAEAGTPPRVSILIRDITARKQAEQALEHARSILAEAQSIAHLGSFEYIAATQTTVWSEEEYRIYGLDPAGPSPEYSIMLQKCIHPEDADLLHTTFVAAMEQRTVYELEHRIVRPDGSVRWVYDRAHPYFDEQGALVRYLGVTLDITERQQTEKLIKQWADAFENCAHGIAIGLPATSQILTCNPAFARLQGRTIDEVSDMPILSMYAPESHELVKREIAEADRTGSSRYEAQMVRKDGSRYPVQMDVVSVRDSAGNLLYRVATQQDITERKLAEEALRQRSEELEQLLDLLPAAIWIAEDPQCQVIHGNRFANELLGVKGKDNISQSAEAPAVALRQFSHGRELNPDELPMQMAARTGQPQFDFELQIARPDEVTRTLLGGAVPLFDLAGQPRGVVAAFYDITERKLVENELRRSNAELEQFAYVASHDLQEPLRAVAGMVQLLQRKYQGQLDERADEYIGHAVEASGRMQALINDLLAYSRVDRRGKPLEAIPAGEALATALANLRFLIGETGAEISCDELPTVWADSTQLTQLFQNLVGNALKFHGKQPPKIQVRATKISGAFQFSVCDNGIGIEPQYFERIFLVFQRLHTRREYAGTGIGLALCKKIVERHGGQIWVESTPGKGSIFHFTLPDSRPA